MADETLPSTTAASLNFGAPRIGQISDLGQGQGQGQGLGQGLLGQMVDPAAPAARLSLGTSLSEQKQSDVAATSDTLRMLMSGDQRDVTRLAVANKGGVALDDPLLMDLVNRGELSAIDRLYGPEVLGRLTGFYNEKRRVDTITDRDRTTGQQAGDAALGLTAGAVGGLGGLASLGLGFVGNDPVSNLFSDATGIDLGRIGDVLGAAGTDATNWATTGLRDQQSDALQGQREMGAIRDQLASYEINRAYEDDVASGRNFPGLRRFGREVISKAEDLWENPVLAGDLIAEGAGSLLAGGLIGKAAKVGQLGMQAVIGGLEAGGSYADIQGQIQGLSEADLSEGSPVYRRLREEGLNHEAAQDRLANDAGMAGATVAGVLGVVSGRLVAKFEANPLGSLIEDGARRTFTNSLRTIGRESLSEGLEEAIQGAASPLISNVAIQQYANENRDLTAGIGQELVAGAVAGAGMVPALRAPDLALSALSSTGQGLGVIGRGIVTAGEARIERIEERADAVSPTGQSATAQAVTNIQTGLEQLVELAAASPLTEPADDGSGPDAQASSQASAQAAARAPLMERATRVAQMPAEEGNSLPQGVQALFNTTGAPLAAGQAMSRGEVINDVIAGLKGKTLGDADRAAASLWLADQVTAMQELLQEDLSAFPESFKAQIKALSGDINTLFSNKVVSIAMARAETLTSADVIGVAPEVTAESARTPQVAQALQTTIRLAQANPVGVDAKFVGQVLDQRDLFDLPEAVVAKLQSASFISQEAVRLDEAKTASAQTAQVELKATGVETKPKEGVNLIRKAINEGGGSAKYQQLSLSKHQSEITRAIDNRKTAYAQERMDALRNFAEHMQNKVRAGRASRALNLKIGNKVKFRTWTGKAWLGADHKAASDIGVSPFSPVSLQFLRDVEADAAAVARVYNNLAQSYDGWSGVKAKPLEAIETEGGGNGTDSTGQTGQSNQGSQNNPGQTPASAQQTGANANTGADQQGSQGTGTPGAGAGTGNPATGTGTVPGAVKALRLRLRDLRAKYREARSILREQKKAYKAEFNQDSKAKKPLTAAMVAGLKLDPKGEVGRELIALGVTPRTSPGLFRNGGEKDLDTLVASEWEDILPGITEATGSAFGDPYLNRNGVLNLIMNEQSGNTNWLYSRQAAERLEKGLDALEGESRTIADELEELGFPLKSRAKDKPNEDGQGTTGSTGGTGGKSGNGNAAVGGNDKDHSGSDAGTEGTPGSDEGASGAEVTEAEAFASFENLPQTKGGYARFNRAFKISLARSPLMGVAAPARAVLETLKDWTNRKSETAIRYAVDEGQTRAWDRLITTEGSGLLDRLNARLNVATTVFNGLTPIEAFEQTMRGEVAKQKNKNGTTTEIDDWLSKPSGMGLNLVNPETKLYDKRLSQMVVMAALHWVMTTPSSQNLDDGEVANIFGKDIGDVTEAMRTAVNSGLGVKPSVESLGRTIMSFWGAEIQKNAPMSDVRGMAEHMAQELLTVMEGDENTPNRFIQARNFETTTADGTEITGTVLYLNHPSTEKALDDIRGSRSLLADAFVRSAAKPFYFGKPPENDRQTQKGNPFSRLSQKMKTALQAQRETPFYANEPQIALMQALGQETWFELMGYKGLEPEHMNRMHASSVEGLNNTVRTSWEGVMEYAAQREAYKKMANPNDPDIPVFFDAYAASNERMMFEGTNPQADKAMREAAVVTWTSLDLTNEDAAVSFWLTVGQSSGLVKTEKDPRKPEERDGTGAGAANAALAEKMIRAKYPDTIELLKAWIADPESGLGHTEKAAITGEIGKGTPKLIHALMSVARYDLAMEELADNPDTLVARDFRHGLSLEADGKTDGPINAILHFTTGVFTRRWVETMRRGGLFLTEWKNGGRTLNDHYASRDNDDLYLATRADASVLFREKRRDISRSPKGKEMVQAIERVILVLGNLSLDDNGELQVTRDMVKEPLTQTGYGAGGNSIAGNVTSQLLNTLYAKLTDLEQGKINDPLLELGSVWEGADTRQLKSDLMLLTGNRLIYWKDKDRWFTVQETQKKQLPGSPADLEDGRNFKLTPPQWQMLQCNIKSVYVDPLVEAIDNQFGNARETLKTFQKATQVQSAVLMVAFKTVVDETLKAKRASGELLSTEFLSTTDYDGIFKTLAKYGAIIEPVATDANSLNLSIKEGEKTSREFSRSFTGELGGKTSITGPRSAGVSASPMLTISRGDALMMVNLFADTTIPDADKMRVFQVFDGLEMPADAIGRMSLKINQAVADAWMESPSKDVAEGFADWLRQGKKGPLGEAGPLAYAAVAVILDVTPDLVDMELVILRDQLGDIARSDVARKNAMRRAGFSVDHMASGESPYVVEGEEPLETDTGLVGFLNRLYEEELAKLPNVRQPKKPAIEIASMDLSERITAYGQKSMVPGLTGDVTQMAAKTLMTVLDSELVGKQHRNLIRSLKKVMPDYKIVFGSAQDLTAWRNAVHPEQSHEDPISYGRTDPRTGVIYIANTSGETIMHEIWHAVMGKVLSDYYAGTGALTESQKTAVKNLETLMSQFADMDFKNENAGTKAVAEILQREIRSRLGQNLEKLGAVSNDVDSVALDRAGALSEFIAWTLTNQNMIDTLSVSKIKTPLQKLKAVAWRALRSLLGLAPTESFDVFSNIRWNAGALVQLIREKEIGGGVQNQIGSTRPDLQELRIRFEEKVSSTLRAMPQAEYAAEETAIFALADAALNRFEHAGVSFTPEEAGTFRIMQAAMASSMEIAPGAMAQTQKIFENFLKGFAVERLMKDPTDAVERAMKEPIFDAIVGKTGTERDPKGRSNLLASVMALAMVNEDFRETLEHVGLPEDRKIDYSSVDDFLTSAAESMMNTLGTAISEEGRGVAGSRNRNTMEALDKLALVISRVETDERTFVEKQAGSLLAQGDAKGRDMMEGLSTWVDGKFPRGAQSTRTGEYLSASARTLAAVLVASKGEAMAETITGGLATTKTRWLPMPLKELVGEVVQMTRTNESVIRMAAKVKSSVSAMRQDYREKMPKFLAQQFSRKLKDSEQTSLHVMFGRTDIATLGETLSGQEIRELILDRRELDDARHLTEEAIKREGGTFAKLVLRKSEELAQFMATGVIHPGNHSLLKNATAIGTLLGTPAFKHMKRAGRPSAALIEAIDQFVTLRALAISRDEMPDSWRQLTELVQTEAEGVDFILGSLVDLKRKEVARVTTEAARMNAWKGFIPEEMSAGSRMIIEDDREHNRLVTMGYTRVKAYRGSGYETGSKSYYTSTVAGSGTYVQGVLQTVQGTAMGVDPRNGRNVSGVTGGAIWGVEAGRIENAMKNGSGNGVGEPLIPIFDADNNVVAYERSLDPEVRFAQNRSTHIGKMMGAWAGRQKEEELAEAFNESLIDKLKENWDLAKKERRTAEFENISDPAQRDKVFGATWDMIPPATKEYIADVCANEPGFMVQQGLVNNALGYRMPSVKDAWEGESRLEPFVKNGIRTAATLVMGRKAVPWLVTSEKAWMMGISAAKHTIVVRSVIVPLSNAAGNVIQLMGRGVPLRMIIKGMTSKLVEITQYLKNLDRAIEIQTLMARYRDDNLRTLKLTAQLKALEDSNKRMSIWPMIEAGEFATIAEGQTEVDAAIADGKWTEWMQNAMERIPTQLGTVGRYAFITRDTALFQGMARAVSYGDFLAKSVLYDHRTKTEGLASESVMREVSEGFVNYNYLPGRTRSYLESMGLTWFWAYKLRSIKTAVNMIRENPLRTLLLSYGAELLPDMPGISLGSPLSDNGLNVILEGKASWSLGPNMLFSSPGLNPWVNFST